jgi:hypothetical protein
MKRVPPSSISRARISICLPTASIRRRGLPLTGRRPIDTIPRLFPDSGAAPRFAMTKITRKSLVGHATVWLAASMLLWPVQPQRACACERVLAGSADSSTRAQHDSNRCERCCRRAKSPGAAESPCCCQSRTGGDSPRACCRTAASMARQSAGACCCGSGCKCNLSNEPDQPRNVPTTPNDGAARRVELGRPLPAVTFAVPSDLRTCGCAWQPRHFIPATAIDRCRVLSRFTI